MKTFRYLFFISILILPLTSHLYAQGKRTRQGEIYGIVEAGYGNGTGKIRFKTINTRTPYEGYFIRLRTEIGYKFTDRLGTGIGFGLDGYHNFTANTAPLFVAVHYALNSEPNSFTVFGKMGYSIPLAANFEKGYMVNLGIGKQIPLRRMVLLPSVGFNAQQITNLSYFVYDPMTSRTSFYEDKAWLKSINVNLGFVF